MKILIVRLSAIGDVVHALPALNALRTEFPDARIDWLVEELYSNILLDHPQLNYICVFQKKWRKKFFQNFSGKILPFYKRLRSVKYDWAIDFQGLTKSGVAAWFTGARKIIGFGDRDGRELNKLFTNCKIHPPQNVHVIKKNLSLLQPFGIEDPELKFVFPSFEKEKKRFASLGNFMAVNPGAGWITKRLTISTLAETCAEISKWKKRKFIITWGPGEEEMSEELREKITGNGGEAELAPPTNLRELCALISRSDFFFGGDTGPTHIAAAMGIPTLSFFGASDPHRNGPYGPRTAVFQKTDLPCVPCWKTECPLKGNQYLQCIRQITAENLLERAEDVLQ